MGGFDGRTRMSSAETYDPKRNQWRVIPSMNKARSDASAAALNGKVTMKHRQCQDYFAIM